MLSNPSHPLAPTPVPNHLLILYRPNGVGCPAVSFATTGRAGHCVLQDVLRCPVVSCGVLRCRFAITGRAGHSVLQDVLRRAARALSYSRACKTLCPARCPAKSCGVLRTRFPITLRAGRCVLQHVLLYPAVACAAALL